MKKLLLVLVLLFLVLLSCSKNDYKVYTANITQFGEGDPESNEFKNSIGVINWSRVGKGYYIGVFEDMPSYDKVWLSINKQTLNGDSGPTIKAQSNGIIIESFIMGESSDGVLINTPIEIRVYD